jgi:hypothetical protein
MKDGEGENPDNSWIVDTAQKILTGLAGAAWWGTKSMNQPAQTPTRQMTQSELAAQQKMFDDANRSKLGYLSKGKNDFRRSRGR